MKKLLCAVLLMGGVNSYAQNYKLTVGEEMKMKKGTTDMKVVAADNTGVYFSEGRLAMKSYFVIGATYGTNYKLIKFDKTFNEVFTKEYKKELKGYDFHSFQPIGNDLFLFATDYVKKEKSFKVYGVRIDKTSGDFIGDLSELGSFDLESKKDDYELKVQAINNGKNFLTVVDISNNDRNSLGVSVLDDKLNKKENAVINLSYPKDAYDLQDVKFTSSKKIVLLGKEIEQMQIGKRKKKKPVFVQYAMAVYNNKGQKEKDIKLSSKDKFVISGKLIEEPDGNLLLSGFYSNTAKKEDLDGFFLNKVDINHGEVLIDSYKEINSGMLGSVVEDDDKGDEEDNKKEKKNSKKSDDDDEDNFPNIYTIKSVDINPADNSYVITAETSEYKYYTYSSSTYNSSTKSWNYNTTTVHNFTNSNILVIGADKNAKIKWMNIIPKKQVEEIRSSNTSGSGISLYTDRSGYFTQGGSMPYYSSFASLINKNQLILILNDHKDNNMNAQYGDKVKSVYNFKRRSNTYGVAIDLSTGKTSRKFITANSEDLIMMPRHGYVVNNEIYIPTWKQHALAKTEFKMAKIAVN